MRRQRADLRVVLFDGQRHALYWRVNMTGNNIYTGTQRLRRREIFRLSYHESGHSNLAVMGRPVPSDCKPSLDNFMGKFKVAAFSGDRSSLPWNYRLKQDSAIRRNFVLDLRSFLDIPSWTVELWAVEAGRPDLVTEILLTEYEGGGRVLTHLHADWTVPELLLVAWTLTPEAWAALERSVAETSASESQSDQS